MYTMYMGPGPDDGTPWLPPALLPAWFLEPFTFVKSSSVSLA